MHLVAVGKRMPAWIKQGYQEFNKRLTGEFQLNLIEIPPAKKTKSLSGDVGRKQESDAIRKAIPASAFIIALDETGKKLTSTEFASRLQRWQAQGNEVCFIIGGANGLDEALKRSADVLISLSDLTLPHALVRIVLIEQLYRAWSILNHHPYHRE